MSVERPEWLPEWSARDAVEIGRARRYAWDVGMEPIRQGTVRGDPRVGFGDGVRQATAWAVGERVPSPNRGGAVGPARGVDDVRLEITLIRGRLGHAPERLRPYGEGMIAALAWLIGDTDVIVYPGGYVYRDDTDTAGEGYSAVS